MEKTWGGKRAGSGRKPGKAEARRAILLKLPISLAEDIGAQAAQEGGSVTGIIVEAIRGRSINKNKDFKKK